MYNNGPSIQTTKETDKTHMHTRPLRFAPSPIIRQRARRHVRPLVNDTNLLKRSTLLTSPIGQHIDDIIKNDIFPPEI